MGAVLTIEATFADGSAETFPVYDPQSEALVSQQESLHMSWFVTGGIFEHDHTGTAAGDTASSTSNQWTAPEQGGLIYLWLVLRDSRGGVDYKSYQIQVGS
jgi:Trm5-related predicted tRNA methylase